MTQKDKELLLKDLCARLLYGVKFKTTATHTTTLRSMGFRNYGLIPINLFYKKPEFYLINEFGRLEYKPYLRPMSSMTEEERVEFSKLLAKRYCEEDWEGHVSTSYCIEIDNVYTDDENGIKYPSPFSMNAIDWLNKKMFAYRTINNKDMFELGLAIEAPKDMYNNIN